MQTLLGLGALGLVWSAPVDARANALAERFADSRVFYENLFSLGHGADLSPQATRSHAMLLRGTLALALAPSLSAEMGLGVAVELTDSDTTFARELLLEDLTLGLSWAVPEGGLPFYASVGMELGFPTSKASRAASLMLSLDPSATLGLALPLGPVSLDLSWSGTVGARLHRFTTVSTQVAIPCSPGAGCLTGASRDTGARNYALELSQEVGLSLGLWQDRIWLGLGFATGHAFLYRLAEAERALSSYDEPQGDPSPATFATEAWFEVGVRPHPAVALALGLWTPAGMKPDGSYRFPLGNRNSALYLDLSFYPARLATPRTPG